MRILYLVFKIKTNFLLALIRTIVHNSRVKYNSRRFT